MSTLEAFHAGVRLALHPVEWQLLEPLLKAWPEPVSSAAWLSYVKPAELMYRSRLLERGLVHRGDPGFVRAADTLFPEGLS